MLKIGSEIKLRDGDTFKIHDMELDCPEGNWQSFVYLFNLRTKKLTRHQTKVIVDLLDKVEMYPPYQEAAARNYVR